MKSHFQEIISAVAPLNDDIYGPLYRCALTLTDGTHLPCAILQSKRNVVELARRRIKEEINGKGKIGGADPFGQLLSVIAAGGNRVNAFDVKSATPSPFAPPLDLLQQIHGETMMGWTGWVFEMSDGKRFAYGSDFGGHFLDLPAGYSFRDVAKVHNHSFISESGELASLKRGSLPPPGYPNEKLLSRKVHFRCTIDEI